MRFIAISLKQLFGILRDVILFIHEPPDFFYMRDTESLHNIKCASESDDSMDVEAFRGGSGRIGSSMKFAYIYVGVLCTMRKKGMNVVVTNVNLGTMSCMP